MEDPMAAAGQSRARRVGRGTGLVLAGAVGATALTGIAFAQPGSDDNSGTAVTQDTASDHSDAAWGSRFGGPGTGPVLHGQDTIRTSAGDHVQILIQNGSITAVSADSITVGSEDGFSETYQITDTTKIRVDRNDAKASDLAVGRPVRLVADIDKSAQSIGSTTVQGEAAITEKGQQLRQRIHDSLTGKQDGSTT
jgi:hypothetical protein